MIHTALKVGHWGYLNFSGVYLRFLSVFDTFNHFGHSMLSKGEQYWRQHSNDFRTPARSNWRSLGDRSNDILVFSAHANSEKDEVLFGA